MPIVHTAPHVQAKEASEGSPRLASSELEEIKRPTPESDGQWTDTSAPPSSTGTAVRFSGILYLGHKILKFVNTGSVCVLIAEGNISRLTVILQDIDAEEKIRARKPTAYIPSTHFSPSSGSAGSLQG